MDPYVHDRGMRARAIAALASTAGFVALGIAALLLRPDLTLNSAFLFGDEGHALWTAQRLAEGARLQADVWTPYGPLTSWTYSTATAWFGNTPVVFRSLMLACNTAALVLLLWAIARRLSTAWTIAWSAAILTPMLLGMGPLLGGLAASIYNGLERILIAGAVLAWAPPARRSVVRSLILGMLVGSCQWVRFGTAFMLIAALVVIDLAADRRLRATGFMLAGAAAMEAARILWAFAVLPGPVAFELLWPVHVAQSYRSAELTLPGWKVLVAHYGPAIAGAGLLAAALARQAAARLEMTRETGRAVILGATYLAGAAILFWTTNHYRQYAWLLAAAGGLVAADLPRRWRAAAIMTALPACVVVAKTLLAGPAPYVWIETPNIGAVALVPAEQARMAALEKLRADYAREGRTIVVGPFGAGWHAAVGEPAPTRHLWFVRGAVRPYEYEAFLQAYQHVGAVVMCPDPGSGPVLNLPEALLPAFDHRFVGRRQLAGCVVFDAHAGT